MASGWCCFEEGRRVATHSAPKFAMRKRVRAKGTPPPLPTTLLALAITPLGPNLYDSKFWLTGRTFRFIEPVAASFAAADLQISNIFTADSKTNDVNDG